MRDRQIESERQTGLQRRDRQAYKGETDIQRSRERIREMKGEKERDIQTDRTERVCICILYMCNLNGL